MISNKIYNVDEKVWRFLLKKTFVYKEEISALGWKISKDRITFMQCPNASGTHKLQFLIFGKSKNPRAFENLKKSLSCTKIRAGPEWQKSCSINGTKNILYCRKNIYWTAKTAKKAVLVLDNCFDHPDKDELQCKDDILK